MDSSFLLKVSDLNPGEFLCRNLGEYESSDHSILSNTRSSITFRMKEFFKDETGVFESEDYWIFLEGVVSNWPSLKIEFAQKNEGSCLFHLVKTYEHRVFHYLKGSYWLVVLDKKENKWWGGTDFFGSKQIYFHRGERGSFFSNSVFSLKKSMNFLNIRISLDPVAAYQMLTLGYMIEERTLLKEIKKVRPGYIFIVDNNGLKFKEIYSWGQKEKNELPQSTLLKEINDRFSKSIKSQFELDVKYGMKHLVSLSAGLDSRMTTFAGNKLGYYSNIINYTFSQTGFYDQLTSHQIAKYLGHEWVFFPLDKGEILKNFRDVIDLNDGLAIFYGSSHSLEIMKTLESNSFGIVHTGQLGDVILGGSYGSGKFEKENDLFKDAYSKKLINRISDLNFNQAYASRAQFHFYNRGMNFIQLGNRPLQMFFETMSPFLDLDFVKFCDTIPDHLLKNNFLYDQWILNYYPEAAKFPHNGRRTVGHSKIKKINIGPYQFYPGDLKRILIEKILMKKKFSNFDMNPVAAWFHENQSLKEICDKYIKDHDYLLNDYPELKKDSLDLYFQSYGKEKCQVITLLGGLNRLLS